MIDARLERKKSRVRRVARPLGKNDQRIAAFKRRRHPPDRIVLARRVTPVDQHGAEQPIGGEAANRVLAPVIETRDGPRTFA